MDGSCVEINFNNLFWDFKGLQIVILLFIVFICVHSVVKIKFCDWKNNTGMYNLILYNNKI